MRTLSPGTRERQSEENKKTERSSIPSGSPSTATHHHRCHSADTSLIPSLAPMNHLHIDGVAPFDEGIEYDTAILNSLPTMTGVNTYKTEAPK
ncbi:hypothetical protein BDZ91DRAFT_733603 [Kalaharituber pfeilii]|nr:hypothetical protein BDZ91DRAFT_733603 [Kalaharituber pfeilii]